MTTSIKDLTSVATQPLSPTELKQTSEPAVGGRGRRKRGSLLPIILALAVLFIAGPALFAWCYVSGSFTPWAKQDPNILSPAKPAVRGDLFRDFDFNYPLLRNPQVVKAVAPGLPDGLDVIGVTVGGKHRAYLVRSLVPINGHVVNDLVGTTPVTVSFCSRLGCAKVFTAKSRGTALDVSVAGWRKMRPEGGGMVLKTNGKRYLQMSGKALDSRGASGFPHLELPFTRTKWEVWKKAHPDTDLYLGSASLFPSQAALEPPKHVRTRATRK